MQQLTPHECRVLGVLIEKAMTTPAQYPLSLNAVTTGSNQKNNRDPVLTLTEENVEDALDSLRQKGFVRQVMLTGSRVEKFRHITKEALEIDTNGMVILAEMLLRGPQTVGELRGRASRMHSLSSTDTVEQALRFLMEREPPLVRELPPAPGSRAKRYAQLLCPNLHPLDHVAGGSGASGHESSPKQSTSGALESRVSDLEKEVRELRALVELLADRTGLQRASSTSETQSSG
ncbi:MAG: DUF480 domain-containing protein [Phycisphaerales bacterium]|nr:MAG: DUF480 domain-containing protein [Phycisphaerales bacterium]